MKLLLIKSAVLALLCPLVSAQELKLLASDGAATDGFGTSVALSDGTAVVGSPYDSDNGSGSGSAYLHDASTGLLITKLLPSDGAAGDFFGKAAAISNSIAVVGAPNDDDNGLDSGSAYSFDAVTGVQLAKLLPLSASADDKFGSSVAISGSTAIVGAPGDSPSSTLSNAGSVYRFNAATGAITLLFWQSDAEAGDHFGTSVAISGTPAIGARAVIGAPDDDDNGTDSGSAYLYDANTGVLITKLLPNDGAAGERFGYSVAVSDSTVVVGAPADEDNGLLSGSAYVFDADTGALITKLLPSDGAVNNYFGVSVAVSGSIAVIGAGGDDDNGAISGSAYLFDTTTGTQLAKVLPSDGAANDYFGLSVGISGSTSIVGANGDDDNGLDSGSAYLFATANDNCNDATPLVGDSVTPFDATLATTGAEGQNEAICMSYGSTGIENDVWFEWTAEVDGTVNVSTCNDANDDTKIAAYPSGGCPTDGSSLACNDDAAGCAGFTSSMDFACVAGTTYLIQVGHFPGTAGTTGNISITQTAAPTEPGTPYCLGDGSGTPCPCGNSGLSGEGCRNSAGSGGLLTASYSNSIMMDDLRLQASGLTTGPGLFFQGNNAVNGGAGNTFGDGLRCAGNQVVRLEVQFSSGGTSATTVSIANKGGVNAGETKRYQLWYRDSTGSPCNNDFNLTNGYEITWTP